MIDATAALPDVGEPLPRFVAPLLTGGVVSDRELRGSAVMVAIWSTDCPGSRAALHELESARAEFEPRGIRFLILATDTSAQRLRTFVDSAHIGSEVARAGQRVVRAFDRGRWVTPSEPYQVVFAKPSFLVVNRRGQVVARAGGYWDQETLQAGLAKVGSRDP